MRSSKIRSPGILADPFHERASARWRTRLRLLGGVFEFECETLELRRLVQEAYAGLPAHRLPGVTARFRLRLARTPDRPRRAEPPRIGTLSTRQLLCGVSGGSDFAIMAPALNSALVVVSRDTMRFPHMVRYELLEFAVYTLATRALGLVPLHAACVGREGRGLLLIGDSGAGKSTTALFALANGWDFVSEDSVLVTPRTLLATGVANFAHVRCDSLHAMPPSLTSAIRGSPVILRRSGAEKFELDLRRKGFRLASSPLRVTNLVFLSPKVSRQRGLLNPLRKREMLERLQTSQPYASMQPGWRAFVSRIAAMPAYELLRGSHPKKTIEALERLTAIRSFRR